MERRIRSALLACPVVAGAEVVRTDGAFTAYVVPAAGGESVSELAAARRHVEEWTLVFDHRYRGRFGERAGDPFAGWRSAYTGEPLSEAEMREWQAASVERVLETRPGRVLELGCGTGLIAEALAGRCDAYWGTDASPAAAARTRARLQALGGDGGQVRTQPAHDLTGLPGGFDVVVMNSVVQYFPSWSYLVEVLERAIGLVADGGHVVIGDVRSLPLLEPYWASVALARLEPATDAASVVAWVEERAGAEPELLIDPAALPALAAALPRPAWATVRPRRGRVQNEMTRFRYDVTLHLHEPRSPGARAWAGVANARVAAAVAAWDTLRAMPREAALADLAGDLAGRPEAGVDPEELWGWGRDAGVAVDVHLEPGAPDRLVLVAPDGEPSDPVACRGPVGRAGAPAGAPANDPAGERARRVRRDLARRIEAWLAGRLPVAPGELRVVPVERLPGPEAAR